MRCQQIAAAAAVAGALAMATPAQAKAAGVPLFAFGETTDVRGVEGLSCPPPPAGSTRAMLAGGTTFGDLDPGTAHPPVTFTGTDTWEACFYLAPDGSATSLGVGHFTGRISGCGTGRVSYMFAGTIGVPDPVTGAREGSSRNEIVPGSGQDGLAGVSGKFLGSTTVTGATEVGTVRGKVRC